jgi:hypothetical protein
MGRGGALAGIVGPIVFSLVFMIEGWLRPDYSPLERSIAELSLGPRGWIQIASFVLCGVLFLIFSFAVRGALRRGTASALGPLLLGAIGFCFIGSGIFVAAPASLPVEQWGTFAKLNAIIGGAAMVLMPLSCLVLARRFRQEGRWHGLVFYSLLTGVVCLAIMVWFFASLPSTSLGLLQRAYLLIYFLWMVIFAARMRSTAHSSFIDISMPRFRR